MAASLGHLVAQLQRWTSPHLEELSDAVLLERFVQRRDESAFAALVARHGGMVLRSCRHVLGDAHEAEDAFQATFLILARKAHTLRQPATLPGFLHSIARRVALKACRSDRRPAFRGTAEPSVPPSLPDPHPDPLTQLSARELLDILDEEVGRLPVAQRSAVILCCLGGHTREEAANVLGCSVGSLKGHLERGRKRLQARLKHRGITLSAALAIMIVSSGEAASAFLLRSTVTTALSGGIGNTVSGLAHSVLRTMLWGKLAGMMTVVLTIAFAASATVALVHPVSPKEFPEEQAPAIPIAQKSAEPSKPPVRTDALGDPLPPRAVTRLGSLRLYHGKSVQNIALSPDGKWVVSSDHDGNRLWDAAAGRELPLRDEWRQAAIFATRDKLVAVSKQNLDLQLWDMVSGQKIGALLPAAKVGQLPVAIHKGFPEGYSYVALTPDGRTVIVCCGAQVLRFFDVATGKVEEPALKWSGSFSKRLAISADSKILVVQCDDSTIHVWDVERRTERIATPANPNDYGGQIALSPDGMILATGSLSGKRVRLWDTRTLKELPPLLKQPDEFIRAVAFSPDGKQLASINANSPTVRLWDLATRKEVRQFQGNEQQIWQTVFSTDGKYLAAGDGDGVTFWDRATGKSRYDFGHRYTIDSVCFSPDGRRLASGAAYTDNLVRIWDPLTGKQTSELAGHKSGIEVVAYSPGGKRIATGSQDTTIRLWDATTHQEVRRLEAKDTMVYAMAFSPDGRTLASGGKRKAVHLWDVATGRELCSFDNPGSWVSRLAFSPDGKWLATRGFEEKYIRLWDVAKGEPIRRLAGPAAGCPSLQFSPEGTMLAAGGDDAAVHFWDASSGEKLRTFAVSLQPGHFNRVLSVAYSPDGRSLAAGYDDAIVRLWELASGQERLRFEGHRSSVGSLAFSSDGTLLASGGSDRIIMVWDVTGQRTMTLSRKRLLGTEAGTTLWNELADADASKAYRAMQTLLAAGAQAVSLLQQRLRPAAAIDMRHMDRLIADLDSDQFPVREKAERELQKLGDDAEPALQKLLAGKPSAEQRLRVKQLLRSVDSARSPECMRCLRAVEVLERLGSAKARQVLQTLAGGDLQSRLTREAKAALERLAKRGVT
jgi:RNA polymerase sigma factor (sigma-70 family)